MKEKCNKNKNRGDASCSKSVRAKWFCCVFKPGFLQIICKASLVSKSNLGLALPIIFKKRRIIRVRAWCRGVQMFKKYETSYPFCYVPLP